MYVNLIINYYIYIIYIIEEKYIFFTKCILTSNFLISQYKLFKKKLLP